MFWVIEERESRAWDTYLVFIGIQILIETLGIDEITGKYCMYYSGAQEKHSWESSAYRFKLEVMGVDDIFQAFACDMS